MRGRYCYPHLTEEEAEAQKGEVICAKLICGTSLVVQWLRLCTPSAGGPGSVPGQGTRVHMPQVRPSAKQIIIVGKDVKECEPSYTVDGDVNWSRYYGKQYRGSSKKK